ncbi:MAG: LAGLIDADG endonuclease [Patescibacteria group bacterium]|nr:LAGLIDADG endonuclease [Patescibacteria group bacterium]
MQLSSKQKNILIGTLLGDAHLEKNGHNVRLRIDHTEKQKEYLKWKYLEFSNFTLSSPRLIRTIDRRTNTLYKRWHFSTNSIDLFNPYRKLFYKNKIKIIPKNIIKLLNSPLSLAVWHMDDGYKRNDCNALRLSTDSFKLEEQKMLQKCLKENFNIKSTLHKKGNSWNIYIPSLEATKFCRIIKPYIISGMEYKISLTP